MTDLSVVFTRFGELDEKTTMSAFIESRRGEPEIYYTQGGPLQSDALASRDLAEQLVVNLTALQGESRSASSASRSAACRAVDHRQPPT